MLGFVGTLQFMRRTTQWVARWWSRLAVGSAFTLALAVPAVALADTATEPETAPPPDMGQMESCMNACNDAMAPAGATREEQRQAAEQDDAQSSYQLGDKDEGWNVRGHPYTQAHYQLGAGHKD